MRIISGISFLNPQVPKTNPQTNYGIRFSKNLSCDRFERTNTVAPKSEVSFTSNVSNGSFLRNLYGIHDPYSGVVIINNKQMNKINQELPKHTTARGKINYLNDYTDSMLPVEKTIYGLLKYETKHWKGLSLQEILLMHRENAVQNLIHDQKLVFDKMNTLVPDLSEENQTKVKDLLHKAKKQVYIPHEDINHFNNTRFLNELIRISQSKNLKKIEAKINELPDGERQKELANFYEISHLFKTHYYNENMKGQTPFEKVKELQAKYIPETLGEENEISPLIDMALNLPSSKNNISAFIVELSGKDDLAISKRLVSESLGTIEHIVPESKGGVNEAYNFLFVTKARNNERGNMSLRMFMKKYPDIPQHCQTYINDIMNAGEKHKLGSMDWYPYLVNETLKQEIGVKLDLRSYKIPPQKAFKLFPERLKPQFPKFEKYYTTPEFPTPKTCNEE